MSPLVQNILKHSGASKERVSPIDIVMGDHWGEIQLGNPMRLSLLGLMLRNQKKFAGQAGGGRGSLLRRVPLEIVRRSPQAMVKVIRKGGTTNARGMRDQMSYLEKDGDAVLERSERYFGAELDVEAQEELIEAWGLSGETKTNSDKTTHFVVSFPHDTEHGAAYRAGRAWADEMFASGRYGDVYDYYTAFHTDRAHPHIHIVVNRRGLENGDWLRVSRRSQFNYDEFRQVQVEVAMCEGIILEATPRLARGVSDRPIPDAEIRRAEREGREAKAPEHTPVTAMRAAASIVFFAEHIAADARLLMEQYPDLAKTMQSVAQAIREGQEVRADIKSKPVIDIKEARQQSEFIMSRRSEILDGIKQIDTELDDIPSGSARIGLEKEASRIKADAAQFLPDVIELRVHADVNSQGLYRGVTAAGPVELEIKERADRQVGELAESVGIDPEKFVGRYEENSPASKGLAEEWRKDELENIQKNLKFRSDVPQSKIEEFTQTAYDDLHRNALQTYRKAERELEVHAHHRKDLYRIARLVREGHQFEDDFDDAFRKTIKDTLHTSELRQLESGDSQAFQHITKNADEQRVLARRYLEAEIDDTDGPRHLQLEAALAKLDRDTDLSVQQASTRRSRDDGLDR